MRPADLLPGRGLDHLEVGFAAPVEQALHRIGFRHPVDGIPDRRPEGLNDRPFTGDVHGIGAFPSNFVRDSARVVADLCPGEGGLGLGGRRDVGDSKHPLFCKHRQCRPGGTDLDNDRVRVRGVTGETVVSRSVE